MRKYTNKLLEMVDNQELHAYTVLQMALAYMSETDVKDMMEMNELVEYDEEIG